MSTLIIFNKNPYDGTDVTWNGLRLAEQLLGAALEMNIFLMNDSVDLARDVTRPPEGYFDGVHKGQPYFDGAQKTKMAESAEWVKQADKVITF